MKKTRFSIALLLAALAIGSAVPAAGEPRQDAVSATMAEDIGILDEEADQADEEYQIADGYSATREPYTPPQNIPQLGLSNSVSYAERPSLALPKVWLNCDQVHLPGCP